MEVGWPCSSMGSVHIRIIDGCKKSSTTHTSSEMWYLSWKEMCQTYLMSSKQIKHILKYDALFIIFIIIFTNIAHYLDKISQHVMS